MSFSTAIYLRKATSRAKSDVANKLVSMFLHELSRRICASLKVAVTDEKYAATVFATFDNLCAFCGRSLEHDRVAVEHLDAMNRFRVGLHIPGNVVVSCKRCNGEKRRDDSLVKLGLAESGWESFLSHDSSRCNATCKTCQYWRTAFPNEGEKANHLQQTRIRIQQFHAAFPEAQAWSLKVRTSVAPKLAVIYKNCQNFAIDSIKGEVEAFFKQSPADR